MQFKVVLMGIYKYKMHDYMMYERWKLIAEEVKKLPPPVAIHATQQQYCII